MQYSLGERSRQRLEGVHHDLVRVVERAIQITPVDFTVLEGLRTIQRQQQLLAAGATGGFPRHAKPRRTVPGTWGTTRVCNRGRH